MRARPPGHLETGYTIVPSTPLFRMAIEAAGLAAVLGSGARAELGTDPEPILRRLRIAPPSAGVPFPGRARARRSDGLPRDLRRRAALEQEATVCARDRHRRIVGRDRVTMSSMWRWGRLVLLLAIWPSAALAQAASVADLVRTSDGSFYRGVIVESTEDHVSLRMPSGEMHTFARADVTSAGPEIPAVAEPEAAPPAPTTHLHAQTDGMDLTLTRVAGRRNAARMGAYWSVQIVAVDRFEAVCALPCDVDVPAGEYQLAITRARDTSFQGSQRAERTTTLPPGDVDLFAHYEDREGIRIAGWVTAIVGELVGLGMVLYGVLSSFSQPDLTMIVTGASIAAVGLAVGFSLAFWTDSAEVHASVAGVPIDP